MTIENNFISIFILFAIDIIAFVLLIMWALRVSAKLEVYKSNLKELNSETQKIFWMRNNPQKFKVGILTDIHIILSASCGKNYPYKWTYTIEHKGGRRFTISENELYLMFIETAKE